MGPTDLVGGKEAVDAWLKMVRQPGYKLTKNDIGRLLLLATVGNPYSKMYDLAWNLYFKIRFPKQPLFNHGTYEERIQAAKRCVEVLKEEKKYEDAVREFEKIRREHEKLAMRREVLERELEERTRECEIYRESLGGMILY